MNKENQMLAQIFSEKSLLIVVTVVGMAFCTAGIGQVAARGEWLQPMAIVAYVIGALILVIVGATLFNIPLPLIDSTRAALIAVVVLAVLKVMLTQLHHLSV
jgi:hypothetical protein